MTDHCPCCHAPRPIIDAGWGYYLCPDCKAGHAAMNPPAAGGAGAGAAGP